MGGCGRAGLACAALAFAASVHAQPTQELRTLIDEGRAEAAYQLARKTPERLGNPEFDLLFGIAAIHSGRAAEGVLALERFVLLNPRHEAARLELARGYFVLGDDARAREEFELAARSNPSPGAAQVIGEHLEALRQREGRYRRSFAAYAEIGGGYDSNPRAGVDSPTLLLPVLGEVTVLDTGVRQADTTWTASAGFRASVPLRPRLAAFAAGQVDVVRYPDTRDFDQEFYAGSIGVAGQYARHLWRAGVTRGYQTLNREGYRQTYGAFADWTSALDPRHSVTAALQAGRFEYAGASSVRDSDFQTVTLGVRRLVAGAWRPQLDFSVNAGREKNTHGDRQDLSRDLYGARLGAAATPRPGWALGAAAVYQHSKYREADAVLLTTREDRYSAAELVLSWAVTPSLSLRAEVNAARNDSNLALYDYRRTTALIKGRYEIR